MTAPVTQDQRTDIVERLRAQEIVVGVPGYLTPNKLAMEAADEIERLRRPTPPADMEGAREKVIEGLAAAIRDPECPVQFSPLLMEARKMLAADTALQRTDLDCRHCGGKGHVPGDPEADPIEECDYCKGKGKITVGRELLRRVVDLTYGYANENESVPSTKIADKLIDKAVWSTRRAVIAEERGKS